MSDYRAPVKDMRFVINELSGLRGMAAWPVFAEATPDLVDAVLDEAAQLANTVIAPTNRLGDEQGAQVRDGQVHVPDAFTAAYRQYIEGGWPGIVMNPEFGGQGLPNAIGVAVEEMLHSANMAWSLCPMLTQGAIHALESHGSPELQQLFLEKLIAGEWTGTMNLTEPQAGSDLSLVRTQAVPDGELWRVSGQKIFITWGDHDMTDNVIHLVLARTPDAPEGVKGLSLFIVPKFAVAADGAVGAANGVEVVSIEHKLGIHASPTCVLNFKDAGGYLVGEVGDGLACMFTMMNSARLNVGLQGVAIAERAYQDAVAYALDRKQGRTPGAKATVAIIEHPDVRRMLLTIKAETEAMRALAYVALAQLDASRHAPGDDDRAASAVRVDLLTPIVKGWCTERAQELTSIAVQVHGGMGYVEETGVAQHMRDARILTIYEGTTGIQAADLTGRKILRDAGTGAHTMLAEMQLTVSRLADAGDEFAPLAEALGAAVQDGTASIDWLLANSKADAAVPGAASYHLLMQFGTLAGAWQMGRAALAAQQQLAAGDVDTDFWQGKLATARFYFEHSLPRARAHAESLTAGTAALMSLTSEQFERS